MPWRQSQTVEVERVHKIEIQITARETYWCRVAVDDGKLVADVQVQIEPSRFREIELESTDLVRTVNEEAQRKEWRSKKPKRP